MPEFLQGAVGAAINESTWEILIRLAFALAGGFLVSWIYRLTRSKAEVNDSLPATLVLLSVLIAMVTGVIGDSVARAFSLVGALSIVRFRTVVRNTQDIAFVMFSVVVGMAAGAGAYRAAIAGIAFAGIAAKLTAKSKAAAPDLMTPPEFLLSVTVSLGTDLDTLKPILEAHAQDIHLRVFGSTMHGAALRAVFGLRIREGGSATELVRQLNRTAGVQGVELERPELVVD